MISGSFTLQFKFGNKGSDQTPQLIFVLSDEYQSPQELQFKLDEEYTSPYA